MPAPAEPQTCSRCILPATFPGVSFDSQGVCNHCRETPAADALRCLREAMSARMEAVIAERRRSTKGLYDCVVAFSGGKDSTYILDLLVQRYALRCLAVMVDNGFIAEGAVQNCRRVTATLGVDLAIFTPAPTFMQRMYRVSAERADIHARATIRRASPLCNSCINLINNHMLTVALEKGAPLIAGGYVAGQIPEGSAVIEIELAAQAKVRAASLSKYIQHFGEEAERYFGIDQRLVEGRSGPRVSILNPMLTLRISEEQILETITRLGWVRPADTGQNSSNCRLNDLGIAVHYRRHGFNPYVAEIAEQVRDGLMTRQQGLAKAMAIPRAEDVAPQARRLGSLAILGM